MKRSSYLIKAGVSHIAVLAIVNSLLVLPAWSMLEGDDSGPSSEKRKNINIRRSIAGTSEEEHAVSVIQKTTLKSDSPIEELHDEIMLMIFSLLNQKDIPSITRTSKRWQRLMDDNQLWQGYAKRALIVMHNEDYSPDKNYKVLFKSYYAPSFTDLSTLNGGTLSSANGISFDGSVIVGYAKDGAAEKRAFRWTHEKGMESVEKLLTDKGLLPSGWLLTSVNAIIPNGVVFAGDGQYKAQMENGDDQTQTRAWRAVIPRGTLF